MESVFFSLMGSESQMAPLLMLASNCLKRTWRMKDGNIEVKGLFTSDTAKPLCSMHSRMVNQTLQGTSGREIFTWNNFFFYYLHLPEHLLEFLWRRHLEDDLPVHRDESDEGRDVGEERGSERVDLLLVRTPLLLPRPHTDTDLAWPGSCVRSCKATVTCLVPCVLRLARALNPQLSLCSVSCVLSCTATVSSVTLQLVLCVLTGL